MSDSTNKFEANWESLSQIEVPEWFKDAKLGVFFHWGIYSVPAYENEWYPKLIYMKNPHNAERAEKSRQFKEYHTKTWGPLDKFGYKDFIPHLTMEHFDAEEWADLFKETGFKYVVPVGEHHDGFPMYDSRLTDWNAAKMGPKRDLCKLMADASRKAGMRFGVSSHRAHQWNHFEFDPAYDTWDPAFEGIYGPRRTLDDEHSDWFLQDWFDRTAEMVDRFNPDILWFDFGWHKDRFYPWRPKLASYYYNHAEKNGYEPVLQYKWGFPSNTAVFDIERGKLSEIRPDYWQTDTSVSYKSWSHILNDHFKSPQTIIHDLIDIVSKNGNLLLNFGPTADGRITPEVRQIFSELGAWLKINGEAIYGTRPWWTFGEGPTKVGDGGFTEKANPAFTVEDIRFTRKDEVVYAHILGAPRREVLIKSLGENHAFLDKPIKGIALLGSEEAVKWENTDKGLKLNLPDALPSSIANALKITF